MLPPQAGQSKPRSGLASTEAGQARRAAAGSVCLPAEGEASCLALTLSMGPAHPRQYVLGQQRQQLLLPQRELRSCGRSQSSTAAAVRADGESGMGRYPG